MTEFIVGCITIFFGMYLMRGASKMLTSGIENVLKGLKLINK